jgi:hypothetical protein
MMHPIPWQHGARRRFALVIASAASMIDEDLGLQIFRGSGGHVIGQQVAKWHSARRFIATLSMALNPDQ